MIANGFDVAVIEHHASSSAAGFSNPYAIARLNYYNISGIPDSYFDGVTHVVGGGAGTYNSFLSKVNQRLAVPSDFSVQMNGFNDGLDYTVVVTVENVNPYSGSDLRVQLTLTESNVLYGSTPFNYVNRRMWPDANGTSVDFSSNSTQTVMLEFTMDPNWNLDQCELVAFIQDNGTKEVLQTEKVAVLDLMPLFYNNAGCVAMNMVPVTNCSESVAPTVTITNGGADNLTSVDINYEVNDESLNTYNWTGDLGYGETEEVMLPPVSFEPAESYDLMAYTSNPNGNPDEDPMNDTTYTAFGNAAEVVPAIYLFLKLDDYPGETTYELKNSSGTTLYSGGPFTVAGQFVKDTFNLSQDDCYTFYIYDAAGNGLEDGAYYSLRESNFSMFYENYEFASSEELVQFSVDLVSVGETELASAFNVFPNPAKDKAYIEFTLDKSMNAEIQVYDMIGKVVFNEGSQLYQSGRNVVTLDAADLNPGVYFVAVKLGDETLTKKISIY